jgi:predicted transcriptional regulator
MQKEKVVEEKVEGKVEEIKGKVEEIKGKVDEINYISLNSLLIYIN